MGVFQLSMKLLTREEFDLRLDYNVDFDFSPEDIRNIDELEKIKRAAYQEYLDRNGKNVLG